MNCTRIFILRNSETQSKVIVKEVIWSLEIFSLVECQIPIYRTNKETVSNVGDGFFLVIFRAF